MRMKKVFPQEYNFFPATWLLPYDSTDFRSQFHGTFNLPGTNRKPTRNMRGSSSIVVTDKGKKTK